MFLCYVLDQPGLQARDVVLVKFVADTHDALLKRPTVIDDFFFGCRHESSIVCIVIACSVLVYDLILVEVPIVDSFGHIVVLVRDAQLDLVFIHALKHVILHFDPFGLHPLCSCVHPVLLVWDGDWQTRWLFHWIRFDLKATAAHCTHQSCALGQTLLRMHGALQLLFLEGCLDDLMENWCTTAIAQQFDAFQNCRIVAFLGCDLI